jgi:hypothetical protein
MTLFSYAICVYVTASFQGQIKQLIQRLYRIQKTDTHARHAMSISFLMKICELNLFCGTEI